MKYIVFDVSTKARRNLPYRCAQLLWKLQTPHFEPGVYKTLYGHRIFITEDRKYGAIEYDENEEIPLRTNLTDLTERGKGFTHIRDWINFRYPDIDEAQKAFIKQWVLRNETATLEQLILENGGTAANLPALPSYIQVMSKEDGEAIGTWKRVR